MSVPFGHIRHQGAVLASLGEAVVASLWSSVWPVGKPASIPGPEIHRTIAPPADDLIRDFLGSIGGDSSSWPDAVPPHLFPHWAFPLVVHTLLGLPYSFFRVLNAGSRMVVQAPLPRGEALEVRARLESLEEDERKVILRTRVTTGTAQKPDALITDFVAFVPLRSSAGGGSAASEPVPAEAREIDRWNLPANAGLEFALLTGDFNPIHWLSPYARMAGFRNVILHGFGTMARTVESLARAHFAGDGTRLGSLDVRFTRPLVLPANVGLYVAAQRIFVADAIGAVPYLTGSFTP